MHTDDGHLDWWGELVNDIIAAWGWILSLQTEEDRPWGGTLTEAPSHSVSVPEIIAYHEPVIDRQNRFPEPMRESLAIDYIRCNFIFYFNSKRTIIRSVRGETPNYTSNSIFDSNLLQKNLKSIVYIDKKVFILYLNSAVINDEQNVLGRGSEGTLTLPVRDRSCWWSLD